MSGTRREETRIALAAASATFGVALAVAVHLWLTDMGSHEPTTASRGAVAAAMIPTAS